MRIIGLTGSIACGKSTVSSFLSSQGYPVVDGDRLARQLTADGSPVLKVLRQHFGSEIFYDDGSLNRRRLGQIVFSSPQARLKLDALMAPYLMDATCKNIAEIRSSGASICFLDMPLLFEKGYDRLCDSVWTVWIPESLQLSRLIARDGFTREEALERIHAVLSSDEKAARADRIIDNSGSMDNTRMIVSDYLAAELNCADTDSGSYRTQSSEFASPPEQQTRQIPSANQLMENSLYVPEGFSRPDAAKRRKQPRKAAWRMPVWLKSSLITALAFLMVGSTVLILMNAYLHRCEEQHIAEQNEIDRQFPLLYRDLIEQYAGEYNLSPAYVSAIVRNESSFQARAESGAGARGLMQLMPDTAEWIARKLQVDGYAFERMYDPESNIRFGCWYLNYLSRLFNGDPVSVTAAYHAGQGQVKVWLSDPSLSEDGYSLPLSALPDGPTKNYAGRVTRDYGIYQEKYFNLHSSDPLSSASGLSGTIIRTRKQYCYFDSIFQNLDDKAF